MGVAVRGPSFHGAAEDQKAASTQLAWSVAEHAADPGEVVE
jgi:hypothetical protein